MRQNNWLFALFLLCTVTYLLPASSAIPVLRSEVGHMATQIDEDVTKTINRVAFSRLDGSVLELDGTDDNGNHWKAVIPYAGGIGWTSVWTGDFDQNGRDDLLIVSSFPENGRCPGQANVTFLMQDSHGRPFPWVIGTRLDSNESFQHLPVSVAI